MSYTIPVVPRSERLEAFQLVEGVTSADDIRQFAGDSASVGHLDGDVRDLRWVIVRTPRGRAELVWGDWIIRDEHGVIDAGGPDLFRRLYAPATTEAASKLRTRDASDPRNQEAAKLARELVASL